MKCTLLSLFTIFIGLSLFAQGVPTLDNGLLLDYYQNQRFADAADYLKKTFPEPVTDIKILSGLAYSSQMAGRLPEAEGYYERIYMADTTNTAVMFSLGSLNARRGNNIKALAYYKKILLADSTNFNVYKQMAVLSQNTGGVADAIIYLQKANKLNPVEPDVAYDLITFYLNLKQYKKADTVVSIAFRDDTANLLLLFGKAQIDFRLEKYPMTIIECNKLMQAGEQNSSIVNMLGTSYYNLKDYKNCIAAFKLMETSQTASETSYYYTAMSFKALKNHAMAVLYFDKAIKEAVSPNVNSYYSEMADSYDQMHKLKKATAAYQKSLLYGEMPLTYYSLASLYDTELKKKSTALGYYKKFLKSNPPEKEKSYIDYAKRRIGELSR
jgi:tetratricopeptide (TPR) repeat protein